jgi:hypothetical protein
MSLCNILKRAVVLGAIVAPFWAASTFAAGTPAPTGSDASGRFADSQQTNSARLFLKMAAVIESPRCLNCHPADRHPTQGDDMHLHTPPMSADASGHGVPGLKCSACHAATNTRLGLPKMVSIPGNPKWALAPAQFAWQHRSIREICLQMRDPRRNGNRSLKQLHDHLAYDSLVGWAWHPGAGRQPAPMTQATLGQLVQRWIDSGAECPSAG